MRPATTSIRTLMSQREIRSILFVCDMQDKFRPLTYRWDSILSKVKLLSDAFKILKIPRLATEQYPQALGYTVPELGIGNSITYAQHLSREGSASRDPAASVNLDDADVVQIFEKRTFEMQADGFNESLNALQTRGRNQIILCGIEAHVCVLQTALRQLEKGLDVYVVCDAVSSQRPHDRAVALQRMAAAGARLTTAESILFELMQSSEHPSFKAISSLVKEHNKTAVNAFRDDHTL